MKSRCCGLVGSALVGACLSFGSALPAHADSFLWSYENSEGITIGNGQLQTALDNNSLIVTTIGGIWEGSSITGLSDELNSDNLYFPATTFLDGQGLSFTISSGVVNIKLSSPGSPFDSYSAVISDGATLRTISGTFNDAAVPVPGPIVGAGLPGLILACGGFLAWACRRKTAQIAA
jgi:hypothetical protein